MESIYIDIHIHTSDPPGVINENYDVDLLLRKIDEIADGSDKLISLTDHNTINKNAYLKLIERDIHVLLGVELHIKNYSDRPPYHCHLLLNVNEISEEIINKVNDILDDLYPVKEITPAIDAPSIEKIVRSFDDYDFILLPHGGQSHSTFDKSISAGTKFDTTLERSIYYNQFDGFTARNASGLDRTKRYFKKLGIDEFVNLVTCTDNYNPNMYPNAKDGDASPFVPTWMYAEPTFNGLRLSLSESSRLVCSESKPRNWSEYIKSVKLKNDKVDIDVTFTPGLNVVIGGSSSGKTLLVDSVARRIKNDFDESNYTDFMISDIAVEYPAGSVPHYINQNYIMKVVDMNDEENTLDKIDIIKDVFPGDSRIDKKISDSLISFKRDIKELILAVSEIEQIGKKISRTPNLTRLLNYNECRQNPIDKMIPKDSILQSIQYDNETYEDDLEFLKGIQKMLKKHPIIEYDKNPFIEIKKALLGVNTISQLNSSIIEIIGDSKDTLDDLIEKQDSESKRKNVLFQNLLRNISKYISNLDKFYSKLDDIINYEVLYESEVINSMGHKLSIENNFKLNKETILLVINKFLKSRCKIDDIDNLHPSDLFEENFSKQRPKVHSYDDFSNKIYTEFEELNTKKYKIVANDGRDFDTLSAGWKTSIILDLIIGYGDDIAPLIIDQPEDNLATNYINHGLINAIKKTKKKKQIILVSHNATIPMMGDAQNIVLCENDGIIKIRSKPLEGYLYDKSMVDHIAEITDGGKPSIKKRVKKYNLKSYREEI